MTWVRVKSQHVNNRNVRTGPNTTNYAFDSIKPGDEFEYDPSSKITAYPNTWYMVRFAGKTGWSSLSTAMLIEVEPTPPEPIPQPPAPALPAWVSLFIPTGRDELQQIANLFSRIAALYAQYDPQLSVEHRQALVEMFSDLAKAFAPVPLLEPVE